jgi:hypothetical protein
MPLLCRLSPARSVRGGALWPAAELRCRRWADPTRTVWYLLLLSCSAGRAGPGWWRRSAWRWRVPRVRRPLLGAVADSAMPFYFLLRQPAFLALAWLLSRHPCLPLLRVKTRPSRHRPVPRLGHSQRKRGRVGHPGPECR